MRFLRFRPLRTMGLPLCHPPSSAGAGAGWRTDRGSASRTLRDSLFPRIKLGARDLGRVPSALP